MPRDALRLTADEARRCALGAQGLAGRADRRAGAAGVLERLSAVQLDTISVLARSHELVAYARLGALPRARIEAAYWGDPPGAFEYWSHAASIVPMADWPWYASRRRRHAARLRPDGGVRREVLRRLEAEGPLTARELGGARRGGPWWDWSPVKRAAEELLAAGTVVCVARRGWHRVYDLAERAIPAPLHRREPTDHECAVALARRAAAALGVATLTDLADYHRQRPGDLRPVVADAGLVPVDVDGWDAPAWADPAALDAIAGPRRRGRTTLLSPFDSLIWNRPRTERIFGLRHRLEAYVPAERREHGYFAMPVLAGGRLVGRVDPARRGSDLVVRRVGIDRPGAVAAVARAIVEAAGWVAADGITVERVSPPELGGALRAALRAATPAT